MPTNSATRAAESREEGNVNVCSKGRKCILSYEGMYVKGSRLELVGTIGTWLWLVHFSCGCVIFFLNCTLMYQSPPSLNCRIHFHQIWMKQ